jgi:hemerythrin
MRQALVWREHFSVGHTGLDDEHRLMIDAINAICESERADSGGSDPSSRHESLRALSLSHFEHEEAILNTIRSYALTEPSFPASIELMSEAMLGEHIHDHMQAIEVLNAMISRSRERGEPLCEDLTAWFVSHAVKYDAHLKAVFQGIQNDCPALFRKLV